MRTRPDETAPAALAVALIAIPPAYGLYRTIADWPAGVLTLGAVLGVYLTGGLLLSYHRSGVTGGVGR